MRVLQVNSAHERLTGLAHPVSKTARELLPTLEPAWIDRFVARGTRIAWGRCSTTCSATPSKCSRGGGQIVLRVEAIGAEARVNVADEGEGVAAEVLPRLFERYYRADRAETSSVLGIGLYISRMPVGAHGGRNWAESAPEQGSAFTVALPV